MVQEAETTRATRACLQEGTGHMRVIYELEASQNDEPLRFHSVDR